MICGVLYSLSSGLEFCRGAKLELRFTGLHAGCSNGVLLARHARLEATRRPGGHSTTTGAMVEGLRAVMTQVLSLKY